MEDRNGTLDSGLDTTHAMFVTLRTIGALTPLALSLFQNSNFFLSQNNVIEIVLSCFLIFRIKETKDYVTSPRAWTCDFLPPSWSVSYVISLSPCGVNKETLATSTLRFPREVRRRNENLGNLFSRSRSRSLGSRSRSLGSRSHSLGSRSLG